MKISIKLLFTCFILIGLVFNMHFGCKREKETVSETNIRNTDWIIIDENYSPRNVIEEFIKRESAEQDSFPVSIKNYGKDPTILKNFSGRRFAKPTEGAIKLFYKDMIDWIIIDLKYKTKTEREVLRTVLYIQTGDGDWIVGDSGSLGKQKQWFLMKKILLLSILAVFLPLSILTNIDTEKNPAIKIKSGLEFMYL